MFLTVGDSYYVFDCVHQFDFLFGFAAMAR